MQLIGFVNSLWHHLTTWYFWSHLVLKRSTGQEGPVLLNEENAQFVPHYTRQSQQRAGQMRTPVSWDLCYDQKEPINKTTSSCLLDTVVKTPLRTAKSTPTGFESWLHSWLYLSRCMSLGRQQTISQVVGSLTPCGDLDWVPGCSFHWGTPGQRRYEITWYILETSGELYD